MGVSTNALLFYGYAWDEDVILVHLDNSEEREDWAELLARQRGIANPWDGYPHDAPRPVQQAWKIENRAAMEARWAAKKAIEAEYAVSIGHYGSASWRCPFIYVKSTLTEARRGCPQDVTTMALGRNAGWDAELKRFLADTGISARDAEGPGWFLTSWWNE